MSKDIPSVMKKDNRYYDNPFKIEDIAGQRDEIRKELRSRIRRLMFVCINAPHTADGGLYTGSLGIVYAVVKVFAHDSTKYLFTNDERLQILSYCDDTLKVVNRQFEDLHRSEKYAFLFGKPGFHFVSILYYRITGNTEMLKIYQGTFDTIIKSCIKYTKEWEVLYGFAGILAMLFELERHGLQFADQDEFYITLFKTLFIDGVKQAARYNQIRCGDQSLLYPFNGSYYIGAAHGSSGIIQTMLKCIHMFHPNERTIIQEAVDDILKLQTKQGHFPATLNEHEDGVQLVHWCHGTPGVIYMLAQAYMAFSNQKYLDSCVLAAEFIWKYGLLKKGPGLCHGISGNGYAFLMMYRLTGDQRYHDMALAFAAFMKENIFMETSLYKPDHPLSLFEGMAGELCYLCDVLNPSISYFPLLDI